MTGRNLLTDDELKNLPKGTFIVMRTGMRPVMMKLKLFPEWGIPVGKEGYSKEKRMTVDVRYASLKRIEREIEMRCSSHKTEGVWTF